MDSFASEGCGEITARQLLSFSASQMETLPDLLCARLTRVISALTELQRALSPSTPAEMARVWPFARWRHLSAVKEPIGCSVSQRTELKNKQSRVSTWEESGEVRGTRALN